MISWIRRHPWLATTLSFTVITAPQWIASLWALFSAEPLVPWLLRHKFPHPVFSAWWFSGSVGGVFFAMIWWALRKQGSGISTQQPSDIKFELVPDRWASPVLATVTNTDRDYPVHIKASSLFGIRSDGTSEELQKAWNKKFQDCVTLPYSLPPDRRAQLAYPGHFPFSDLRGLFAKLELENGRTIVSPTISPPKPPNIPDHKDEELDRRDRIMVACADAIDRGKKMFWALLEVRADELIENDDVVYICDTLKNEGHENQLDIIPKSSWLFVLKKARLRPNRPRSEVELYDFICELANLRKPTTAVSDDSGEAWKQLEIEALPASPNNKNLTQLAWNKKGRPPFDAFCILAVRNPNLAQGIDGVALRLLNITPELASARGFDPATNDVDLRKLQFNFTDISGNTLKGDQTAYVTIFKATRLPTAEESLKNITVEFDGNWPATARNSFIPQPTHLMTAEVTANGLRRTEAQFEISFSTNPDEPVFTLTKLSA